MNKGEPHLRSSLQLNDDKREREVERGEESAGLSRLRLQLELELSLRFLVTELPGHAVAELSSVGGGGVG